MNVDTSPTLKEIKKKLLGMFDQVSKKNNGNFIARRGFFYTHGQTIEQFVTAVKQVFPKAVIVDSDEVWKSFRGGASIANSSHWYVEFRFPVENQENQETESTKQK